MHLLLYILLVACAVSWAYWLVAWASLRSVLRTHVPAADFTPCVSILKPIKGVDAGALENFQTFCEQDYPDYELLFGVADGTDPAVRLVDELKARYPQRPIRLVVAGPLGANPKAAVLERLASEARGQVLVISDSDIRVTPQYLRRVVRPLENAEVGLVTCLYRGEAPTNLPARLEALYMDSTFAPSAALAWRLGTTVGCGATLAMRPADLSRAGGYAAIANHLLDDYEIAARMASLGLRVCVSDYPVASVLGSMRFADQWDREIRWSRGIRAARPLQYPGMVVTFSMPLGILVAGFSGMWHVAWTALVIALIVRGLVAWRCAVLLGQRERRYLLLLPLRDPMTVAVWLTAMFGRHVTWRGQKFLLCRDGRLEPLSDAVRPTGLLARAIQKLDAHLRRRQGIFEYWDDEQCVLRLSIEPAEASFDLVDGSHVSAGEPVGVVHFWNEHMPLIPRTGPDLAWAMQLRGRMNRSLSQLAVVAQRDPRLVPLKAFGADAVLVSRNGEGPVARVVARFGFETVALDRRPTVGKKVHRFFENFLILALLWAFNPAGTKGKRFFRPREPIWMSRSTLMKKHGDKKQVAEAVL